MLRDCILRHRCYRSGSIDLSLKIIGMPIVVNGFEGYKLKKKVKFVGLEVTGPTPGYIASFMRGSI